MMPTDRVDRWPRAAHGVVLLATASLLAGCARAPVTTTPGAAQAREARERACTLAREDAMRALWLGSMFSLSDPIMVGRGPTLGAPTVPRPCAELRADTVRVR
jgi:hypothetical protein